LEFQRLLANRQIPVPYDVQEFRDDLDTLRKLGHSGHREQYLTSSQPRSSVAPHHLLCIFLADLTALPCPMCPIRPIRPIRPIDLSDSSDSSDLLDPSDPTVPIRRVPAQTALLRWQLWMSQMSQVSRNKTKSVSFILYLITIKYTRGNIMRKAERSPLFLHVDQVRGYSGGGYS